MAALDSAQLFSGILSRIDRDLTLEDKIYVAIPSDGCSSCIRPAFEFMRAHYKIDDFVFIITEVSDFRLIENKLGKEILENDNVWIDSSNLVTLNFYSIYPQVFVFKHHRLTRYVQVDSRSSYVWETLRIAK